MRRWRRGVAAVAAVALAVAACSSDDDEPAGSATSEVGTTSTTAAGPPVDVALEGPIEGGERGLPYNAMPEGFEEDYGYVEEEWFASGEASAYTSEAPLTTDGQWAASTGDRAEYTTRILVRKPADPGDFNGVVLVEWLNASAGRDSDPEFGFLHPEILRDGYGYMAVSAQQVGISGGPGRIEVPGVPAEALAPLQEWDPERYAPLSHPGDDFSYDLFAQMGAVAEGRGARDPFEGMEVTTVLALGQSQSAFRLVTFANAVQPGSDVFDGLLIHSPSASAAPLSEAVLAPSGTLVRDDLEVPVLLLVTETDLTFLGYRAARQPDTDRIATWEVAGTAHADQSTLDYGAASGARWSDLGGSIDLSSLCGRANSGPHAEVARAALVALASWADGGTPPSTAPRIEISQDDEIERDTDGNAVGGIRTPAVDAAVSTQTGDGNPSSVFCSLFGQEVPFTQERLAELYPTTDDYVDAVTASADAAAEAGFLLPGDGDALVEGAAAGPGG